MIDALVAEFAERPDVTLAGGRRGFGSDALQCDGRIFAMARRGGLVLKLPAGRVAELLKDGAGQPYDAGKGRPLREWVLVIAAEEPELRGLVTEALEFSKKPR